ncbi:MAG: hypothetical protein V4565_07395 [Bacteroidota bacterium]
MHSLTLKNKYNAIFLILWIGMSVFLVLRTYFVDITDDEAWSYYNVKHFWWVEVLCSGNTHWFNFLAIKAVLICGFEKAWQLRWFSLLSGIIFLYIGYCWIKSFNNLMIKVLAFSLIFFNPYLIEYLTLARGYSSALCFMALSLYFYIKEDKLCVLPLGLLFAGMSAIANFNFLYFFVPFVAFYFCQCYLKNGKNIFKNKSFYMGVLYTIGILFLVLRALLFIKQCSNDIGSFGGVSLVDSVFCSYIDTLFYGQFFFSPNVRFALGTILFILVIFASIYGSVKYKTHRDLLFLIASVMLLGMLFLVTFNHWCFHVLYPTERTALMFYSLAVIVIVQLANHISINKVLLKTVLVLISTVLIVNFFKTAKLVSGYDHSYCMNTKQYFDYLGVSTQAKKVGLAVEVYFIYLKYYQHTTCDFYAESINEYRINPRYLFNNQLSDFDYLLLLPPYNLSYYKKSPCQLHAVKYFPNTGALIVKVQKK